MNASVMTKSELTMRTQEATGAHHIEQESREWQNNEARAFRKTACVKCTMLMCSATLAWRIEAGASFTEQRV